MLRISVTTSMTEGMDGFTNPRTRLTITPMKNKNPLSKVIGAKKKAETKLQAIGTKAAKTYKAAVKKARSTPEYKKKQERARYEGAM